MYCPNCGSEYREGFYECADCGVALTAEPPAPPAVEQVREPVAILETGDPAEVAFVESLLQNAGIPVFKKGEGLQDLFGLGRMGVGFNPIVGPIVLLVPAEDAEAAVELLESSTGDEPRMPSSLPSPSS
jgi:hypothetical protein